MRDLPRLLPEAGLELVETDGTLYANIGRSRFWVDASESYGLLFARSGLLPPGTGRRLASLPGPIGHRNTFFRASNYYAYLTRRPE
jgi:hypothetical protein